MLIMKIVLIIQHSKKENWFLEDQITFCLNDYITLKSKNTSDAFELEIGELSRAESSWIFPSWAELVGFRNRAEPSWIFLETSWIRAESFWVTTFFVSNKFTQKVIYGHKFQVYWCFWSIVLSDFLLYQINIGIKSNFDNVLLFLTIFHLASWIF